jgi:hypothetical protein
MHFLAAQIDGADLTCVAAYRQSTWLEKLSSKHRTSSSLA